MKAEDVATALERQESDGHARLTPAESANAIRELIEERNALRVALADAVEWMGQSDHTKPAEWVDNAIAALEQP